MPASDTFTRQGDKTPAYWMDRWGVVYEANRQEIEDSRPLIWADRPLTKERLKELYEASEGKPLRFARLIEQEHGIR